jgi:hypothetical protein
MYSLHLTDQAHRFKGIRETDIQDYYLPSPLAHAGNTPAWPDCTPAVPLPTRRLVRRGRD